jgi:hypothetical protein
VSASTTDELIGTRGLDGQVRHFAGRYLLPQTAEPESGSEALLLGSSSVNRNGIGHPCPKTHQCHRIYVWTLLISQLFLEVACSLSDHGIGLVAQTLVKSQPKDQVLSSLWSKTKPTEIQDTGSNRHIHGSPTDSIRRRTWSLKSCSLPNPPSIDFSSGWVSGQVTNSTKGLCICFDAVWLAF